MEETTSINILSTFCGRIKNNFEQNAFFGKCQREKCVLLGVIILGRKALQAK
jgi:hypothetical protein